VGCGSGKIPIYKLPLNTPGMYHFIIQQLDKSQPPPTVDIAGDRGGSVAGVTPNRSKTESEMCGIVRRKEYEEDISSRKVKKWADSIIITYIASLITQLIRGKG